MHSFWMMYSMNPVNARKKHKLSAKHIVSMPAVF